MPFLTRGAARLYWKVDGAEGRPPLVLLNSIGTDMRLWDAAMPYLLPDFLLLRMDMRGHGASDAPGGEYTLDLLAEDVAAVMAAAGISVAAVAGVSLGGMVAMRLELDHPALVSGLALICTSARMDPAAWADRIAKVRAGGMAAIADLAMSRFLSHRFARTHPEIAESVRRGLLATAPDGYTGAAAAIRDMALFDRLPALRHRTLVVAGDDDVSTPFDGHAEHLAAKIPDTKLVRLATGHLAPLEAPGALAAALQAFLLPTPAEEAAQSLFAAGLVARRRVLGDAWVDRSLAKQTPFTADFQSLITRIAWYEIWSRPGLEDRVRRLLVLAVTAALGRWEEFGLHVRSGLEQGGFTRDELKEVLLQLAIYAGVPAANTAFAEAARIIEQLDGDAAHHSQ